MKARRYSIFVNVIGLLAALAFFVCALGGCAFTRQSSFITPAPLETHEATEAPEGSVVFEDALADIAFESSLSTVASETAQELLRQLAHITQVTYSTLPHIKIQIVSDGQFACEDDSFVIPYSQIGSFDVAYSFAVLIRDLPEWVYRGAAYSAVNSDIDMAYIGKKLSQDCSPLSLSPARYALRYNTADELNFNYMTAAAFLLYLNESCGYLKTEELYADKQAFAASLSRTCVYDYAYDTAFDACSEWKYNVYDSKHDVDYPLFVTMPRGTFFVQPLMDCKNASALEAFFFNFEIDLAAIRAYIESNSSVNLSVCTFDVSPSYYFLAEYGNSYASYSMIELAFNVEAALHETMHHWLYPVLCDHWFYEGMAEYLPHVAASEGRPLAESLSFANSMARHALQNPDVYAGRGVADVNMVPSSLRVEGDSLTYDQACSFVAYVAETYTLDPLLALCRGDSFDAAFAAYGKTYGDVYTEWVAWLGV